MKKKKKKKKCTLDDKMKNSACRRHTKRAQRLHTRALFSEAEHTQHTQCDFCAILFLAIEISTSSSVYRCTLAIVHASHNYYEIFRCVCVFVIHKHYGRLESRTCSHRTQNCWLHIKSNNLHRILCVCVCVIASHSLFRFINYGRFGSSQFR